MADVMNLTQVALGSFIADEEHLTEVKTYANVEYSTHYKIRPHLTAYSPTDMIVAVKAPFTETPEDTQEALRQLSFIKMLVRASFYRIIVDGIAMDTNDEPVDAIYTVRFNKHFAYCHALPYSIDTDNNELVWSDPSVLPETDHLVKNRDLYHFTAVAAFNRPSSVNWITYYQFLLSHGFEFTFPEGVTEQIFAQYYTELV